jgi:hypothetical protein
VEHDRDGKRTASSSARARRDAGAHPRCEARDVCQLSAMQLANRHSYGRGARMVELALVALLFIMFVTFFGALLSQVL